MEILNNFVVFEGLDGSGTTTQLTILETFFPPASLPFLYKTFEPTNGSIGKTIRAALGNKLKLKAETVALLFAADRNEHLYAPNGIVERCARGELVVSDRYVPSSLVYQGITCGEELPVLLNRDFPGPELLIFFDIESESALERMAGRKHRDIYERLDFLTQVRQRYKAILPRFAKQGVRVETVDASLPADEVGTQVWSIIQKMPIFKG